MRIVGGELKGRIFSKKLPNGVRPTSELVRESLFNVLQNLIDFDSISVLDICAGTGALGIESISRGAAICTFVDSSPRVCSLIKEVLSTFKVDSNKYKVINYDALKMFHNKTILPENTKFDLIFFDPPYLEDMYDRVLSGVAESNILTDIGLFVVEYGHNVKFEIPNSLEIIKEKKYGDSSIIIFEKKQSND